MIKKKKNDETSQLHDATGELEPALHEADKGTYVLRLYVSGMTPNSRRAIDNVRRICEAHLEGRYQLELIDIFQQPEFAKEGQIVAAPTLVKELPLPLPLRKFIGDLLQTDRIIGCVVILTDITEHKQSEEALLRSEASPQSANERFETQSMELKAHNQVLMRLWNESSRANKELRLLNEELDKRVAERTAELHAKDQILLVQSRQAAMGEMIGNIAHHWRQPLNTLGLTVQQLLLFYDLGEFNREFLNKNVVQSMELIQHMSRTIDDFRNFFRPEKEKAEFNVARAIANSLSLVEDSFKEHHIAVEVVATHDPAIYGYRNEFGQVLLNILNNARDAFIDRKIDDPRVTINIRTEYDRTVVTVADNAGGIPGEIMEKIFDPYFTTKGPQTGTGVGLFMSKIILEKNMGGRLAVRNIANGAEFRIEV